MISQDSSEPRDSYFIPALLGAQANYGEKGFRQRDFKFLVEFFSNWMDFWFPDRVLTLHNTQVMRYLDDLIKEGFAQGFTRQGQKFYRLTRVGLITLIQKLVRRKPRLPIEEFYFVFHVLETYGQTIAEMIRAQGEQFPAALRIEIESALDLRKFIEAHIDYVELEIKKLKQRVADSQAVTLMVHQMKKQGRSIDEMVGEVETKYPYDLNSQKPLSKLFKDVPVPLRVFFLETANIKRGSQIWNPVCAALESHLESLKRLQKELFIKRELKAQKKS